MKPRFPAQSRALAWRLRFLEIAREAAAQPAPAAARLTGLKPRSRMAGFATLRRAAGASLRAG